MCSGCKSTVIIDGEEVVRPCTTYESADFIKNKRAHGRIVTSSGAELRQYPDLTEFLADAEYKKYHNLDLEVQRGSQPTLQILDPRTKRVTDSYKLSQYSSKGALFSLLSSLDFELKERSEL